MKIRAYVWLAGWLAVFITIAAPLVWSQEAERAPVSEGTEVLKLTDVVAEALRANPAIQRDLLRVEARRARVPQARALPDPTISVGYMGDFAPFNLQANDPSSNRQITASQQIPYPGKLRLRGEIAAKEADALGWDYEATRRRVAADAKVAYSQLAFVQKAIETTEKDKDLLQKLAKITEAKFSVGNGIQADVLKAQLEVSRLLQRLTVLRQGEATLRARLNSLMNRPPDAPLGRASELSKQELRYSLEELNQMALANYPELKREERVIEQSQFAMNLAQKEYYPDLTASFTYQNRVSGQPEMFGWMFTVNLPIFYKNKQRQAVMEAGKMLTSARRSQEGVRTVLFFQIKEQYLQARAAEELSTLYGKAIVPQSALALESSLASYEVGKVDFLTVLSNFVTVLDYELNYYQELSNHSQALARLEEMVGTEITK